MIFYHIQADRNFDYLISLIGWIYHPHNFYFISVDASVPDEQIAGIEELQRGGNISVSRNVTLTWGGISPINSLLLGMQSFVASPPHLRYFINLSTADFPIKTQGSIFDTLSPFDTQKPTAWVNSWLCSPEYFVENTTPPNAYRNIRVRADLEFLVDKRIAFLIAEREQSAVLKPGRRVGFMMHEVIGEKLHIVRPLLDAEHQSRLALFKTSGYRVGRGWHVLNREFCKMLLQSKCFYLACQILSGSLLPEESLFQTVLPMLPGEVVHHNRNFRFKNGGPENVHDGLLPELEDSDAFFARELNVHNCRALSQWAQRRFSASQEAFAAATGVSHDLPQLTDSPPT